MSLCGIGVSLLPAAKGTGPDVPTVVIARTASNEEGRLPLTNRGLAGDRTST